MKGALGSVSIRSVRVPGSLILALAITGTVLLLAVLIALVLAMRA